MVAIMYRHSPNAMSYTCLSTDICHSNRPPYEQLHIPQYIPSSHSCHTAAAPCCSCLDHRHTPNQWRGHSRIHERTLPHSQFHYNYGCHQCESRQAHEQHSDDEYEYFTSYELERNEPRRKRSCFNVKQVEEMENHYKTKQYIAYQERMKLSETLKLDESQIKIWFQNRRAKDKRLRYNAINDRVSRDNVSRVSKKIL